MLDPSKAAEAEVLEWLAERDQLHLGMIARASDDDIARHLDGERRLRMPLLPAAEADHQERMEALRPQNVVGWMKELTKIAAETGDDDPDFEAMLLKAQSLADAGCTLADYRSQTLAEAVEEASVIDDREDVG